jgi:vancomycin resistance protein YoaR
MFVVKKHTPRIKIITVIVLVTITFILLINLPFINKVYPNTYVAGIYLGDKTKDESANLLRENFRIPDKITLKIADQKSEISTKEIISSLDYERTVDRAYNFSSTGNFIYDLITKIKLIFKPVNLDFVVQIDDNNLYEILLISTSKLTSEPVYPSASIINGLLVINPGTNGTEADLAKAKNDIKEIISSANKQSEIEIKFTDIKVQLSKDQADSFKNKASKLIGKKIELNFEFDKVVISDHQLLDFITVDGFSKTEIEDEILSISKEINRSPQDSVFIVEDGTVAEFMPSKDGITVNSDVLFENIKSSIDKLINGDQNTISLDIPVVKTAPQIKNEDVNNLGINTLLGKGNSTFKGSIPNRIHNVNLAQSKFKGLLIAPEEVVSFNKILGDVSGLTGYKAAYVIMDGKTVLGDGGGVCQVSTTLFRAVLSAGLPIIERRAHAYRVGYYEQGSPVGLDATVYSPTTDFKFKNDTPNYLLIQPTIDLNSLSLSFEIYGTSDGRIATVSKPIITSQSAPAEDLYVDDPTLPIGTTKQIEHRAYGAKVIFDYKVIRNGEELINQKFVSNYRPWQAVYLRGTAL